MLSEVFLFLSHQSPHSQVKQTAEISVGWSSAQVKAHMGQGLGWEVEQSWAPHHLKSSSSNFSITLSQGCCQWTQSLNSGAFAGAETTARERSTALLSVSLCQRRYFSHYLVSLSQKTPCTEWHSQSGLNLMCWSAEILLNSSNPVCSQRAASLLELLSKVTAILFTCRTISKRREYASACSCWPFLLQ